MSNFKEAYKQAQATKGATGLASQRFADRIAQRKKIPATAPQAPVLSLHDQLSSTRSKRYAKEVPSWLAEATDKIYEVTRGQAEKPLFHIDSIDRFEKKHPILGSIGQIANLPSAAIKAIATGGQHGLENKTDWRTVTSDFARGGRVGAEIGTTIASGGIGRNLLKASAEEALKKRIIVGAANTAVQGAKQGAIIEGLRGIEQNPNDMLAGGLKGALKGGAGGALIGGTLGAALPVAGAGFRRVFGDARVPQTVKKTSGKLESKSNVVAKVENKGKEMKGQTDIFGNRHTGETKISFKGNESASIPVKVSRTVTENPQNLSWGRKLLTSGQHILENSGVGGKQLLALMRSQQTKRQLVTGRWNALIDKTLEGLDDKTIANVDEVLRGEAKPTSKESGTAAKILRNWLNKVGKTAEDMQFEIKNSQGTKVPFKMRENYAPQMYAFDQFKKGQMREKALQHLVDSGQARSKGEAEQMLDGFIMQNAERRSGNLERAREIELPGFERDPRKYLKAYAAATAKRFTEAEHFGKDDSIAQRFINQIADEGGDYREAQRIFDFMYKGAPQNKFVNALTKAQAATRLSLSAITNATQSINTASKAGVINTVKGALKGFTKEGLEFAEASGVYDDLISIQEMGFDPGKIVNGILYLFGKVERFNRRTAANTGRIYAKELAQKGESGYAIRQLKSLGLDPEKIRNGKLNSDSLLLAANKLAQTTQFKISPLDVPASWMTPTGKLVTQFKSFTFMQTKFVRDEILKEAQQGNYAPLARFLVLAPTASFTAQAIRNKVTGRDPKSAEKSMDVRNLDSYLKAVGTMPTDLFTQANFLEDTYKNPYSTPINNISRTLGTFFGPTVGDAGEFISALENKASTEKNNHMFYADNPAAQQNPNLRLQRWAVGKTPYVGQYLKNSAFAFKPTPNKQAKELIKQALRTNDMSKMTEAWKLDPTLKDPKKIKDLARESQRENMPENVKKQLEEIERIKKEYKIKAFY